MNWQHLSYFRALAETQNFTQSAKDLYCTPSTLSKAISSLEEELGFPLFIKSGRNSVLSEYGITFKKYVDESMECLENGIKEIHAQIDEASGSLSMGCIYNLCLTYLPTQIKNFLNLYPNINISLQRQFSVDVLNNVLSRKIDLGFCADFDMEDKQYTNLAHELITKREMVFIVSDEHPLACKSYITFDDIKNDKFIISSNPKAIDRILFFNMCQNHDFNPNIAFELPDDPTIINMITANLGIGCMVDFPESKYNNLHTLHMEECKEFQSFYMIWRKDNYISPASKLFQEYILSTLSTSYIDE